MKILQLAVGALLLGGCAQTYGPLVTYVPTKTPGLKYVIVGHPGLRDDFGDTGKFSKTSHYILLCDGRGVDGMRCYMPAEVGARESAGPTLAHAPVAVPAMVGALTGHGAVTEDHFAEGAVPSAGAPPTPVVAPVIAPPPVPVKVIPKGGK